MAISLKLVVNDIKHSWYLLTFGVKYSGSLPLMIECATHVCQDVKVFTSLFVPLGTHILTTLL